MLRAFGIVGRREVVSAGPFPALFHREITAMSPAFLRIHAATRVILTGKWDARVLAVERGQWATQRREPGRNEQNDNAAHRPRPKTVLPPHTPVHLGFIIGIADLVACVTWREVMALLYAEGPGVGYWTVWERSRSQSSGKGAGGCSMCRMKWSRTLC
jgi:hypothetical protein